MLARSVVLLLLLAPLTSAAPALGTKLGSGFKQKLQDGKLPTPDITRMANALESPKTGKVKATLTLALVVGVLACFVAPGAASDAVADFLGGEFGGTGVYWWQLAGAAAMALNLWAVNQPGRLDGEVADRLKLEDMTVRGTLLPPPDNMLSRSKFQPAGWTFAIWGIIFAGETLWHFLGQFLLPFAEKTTALQGLFAKTAPSWIAACLLQTIWCGTFRPAYRDAGPGYLLVPAAALFAAAGALGNFHTIVREAMLCEGTLQGNLIAIGGLLPHTVHFAWLLAAALVNTNGALSYAPATVPDSGMTKAAIISAGVASVLYCSTAITSRAPVVAAVGAWALSGVAAELKSRELGARPGYVTEGVKTAKVAMTVGAALCGVTAALTLIPGETLKDFGIELPSLVCALTGNGGNGGN